jgi:RNA polymerase sigma-70 factor (ECF subfamily)
LAVAAHLIEGEAGTVDLVRDRALVERYQSGDESAFDELYRRYFDRLRQYCVRRVGDTHVAEELAQESFLKALRAMPRFSGERRFYPWMTVIAQRLCIDHHRRAARTEPAPELDAGSVEADHDDLFAEVDHAYLATAVGRLAPRHRQVLELRESQGWSYQQIATSLSVPVTTVEALLHRARKALRREFLAVTGQERLASLPLAGALLAGIARLRKLLVPAAAGVAAIGVAVLPYVADRAEPLAPRDPAPVVRPVEAGGVPAAEPIMAEDLAPAIGVTSTAGGTVDADPAPVDPRVPVPVLELGGAHVFAGDEGVRYAQAQADSMPIQCDLAVVVCGLDPAQLLANLFEDLNLDSLTPGGTP